jgi:hypothetical protein
LNRAAQCPVAPRVAEARDGRSSARTISVGRENRARVLRDTLRKKPRRCQNHGPCLLPPDAEICLALGSEMGSYQSGNGGGIAVISKRCRNQIQDTDQSIHPRLSAISQTMDGWTCRGGGGHVFLIAFDPAVKELARATIQRPASRPSRGSSRGWGCLVVPFDWTRPSKQQKSVAAEPEGWISCLATR